MPIVTTPCLVCDEPMRIFPTSAGAGRMTHRVCKQGWLEPVDAKPTECAHCGGPFESKRLAASRGGKWIRCCSKSCARKAKPVGFIKVATPEERKQREFIRGELARRKRRARLAGVKREPYTTARIAERDGYQCHLCDGPVDMAFKFPSLESPSVDHIIPLSRGGDDTLANVALAHLGCNLSKGAGDGSKEIARCA